MANIISPSESALINDFRQRLNKWAEDEFKGNWAEFARSVGIPRQSLIDCMRKKGMPSTRKILAMAAKFPEKTM